MALLLSGNLTVTQADVDTLQGDGSLYTVSAIELVDETRPDGSLATVIQVTLELVGRAGSFTVESALYFGWAADLAFAVDGVYQELDGIFAVVV